MVLSKKVTCSLLMLLCLGLVPLATSCGDDDDDDDKDKGGETGGDLAGARGCDKPSEKICLLYSASNSGTTKEIQDHCEEFGHTVVAVCPSANFISSCSFDPPGMKQYYYTGFTNSTPDEPTCTGNAGVYSATYSATY